MINARDSFDAALATFIDEYGKRYAHNPKLTVGYVEHLLRIMFSDLRPELREFWARDMQRRVEYNREDMQSDV